MAIAGRPAGGGLLEMQKKGGGGLMSRLAGMLKRPELWQHLGNVGGAMSRASRGYPYDLSQANERLFQGMQDRRMGEQLDSMMGRSDLSPEQRDFIGTLPVAMRQEVLAGYMFPKGGERRVLKDAAGFQRYPDSGERVFPGVVAGPDQGAVWRQKMAEMVAGGMDLRIARGIATGVYKLTVDEISGARVVTDMATGQPVDYGQGAVPAAPTPVASATTVPDDINYAEGLGGKGYVALVANTVVDLFGGNLPAPDAERASQALTNLQVRTQTILQNSIPGKPSNYLMQQFEKLTVTPGSLTQGPGRAKERLTQTRDLVKRAMEESLAVTRNSQNFSPKQVAEARQNMIAYRSLLRDYETILRSFGDAPPAPPEIGAVDGGYRFMGGDPADPNSWQAVP